MKASSLLCITVLIGCATVRLAAQQTPAQIAEEEQTRRMEAKIVLRQTLEQAKTAQKKNNLGDAAKLYEDAYTLVQKVGVGVDREAKETIAGLTSVRLEIAYAAKKHDDFAEADAQVRRVLRVDPQNAKAIRFKKENDIEIERHRGMTPSKEQLALLPEARAEHIRVNTLVQDAKLNLEMGRLDDAEKKLREAMKAEPDNQAAFYYMNLIHDRRYSNEARQRVESSNNRIVEVEQKWNTPTTRELLPVPNPFFNTNLVHVGPGRQLIGQKLDKIILNEVLFQGITLPDVLKFLNDEARKRDPDKKGINFLINPNAEAAPAAAAPQIDPNTGQPLPAAAPEQVDLNNTIIRVDPALHDITLANVLDVITKVADHPIKVSIEEYAIVFSQKTPDQANLQTRYFNVNPNTFVEGLQGVYGLSFGVQGVSQGGGGGGIGGGGGQGGQNGQGIFSIPAISVGGQSQGGQGGFGGGGGGGGQQGNGQGGVLSGITSTNLTQNVQDTVRAFFTAAGINVLPPNAIFWNDRKGYLMVRATPAELDLVQQAIEVLNALPPQILIEAKFAEFTQSDSKGIGFDWFTGNFLMGGQSTALSGGTAPSFPGNPNLSAGNPFGVFPGTFGVPQNGGNSATDQQITKGLRNSVINGNNPSTLPAVATVTGILTDPQFRVVIRALEQRSGVDLLAAPRVTTVSGRQAQMQGVDVQTIVAGLNTGATGAGGGGLAGAVGGAATGAVAGTVNYSTQSLPFGPVLDVVPYVSADGYTIQMTLIPTHTEFIGYDDPGQFVSSVQSVAGNTVALPLTAQLPLPRSRARQVTTTAIVWDGQTIVLGGLIAEDVRKIKDKVPVLGDLPLVGKLFRSETSSTSKRNLMIFVTPTIIDPAGNPVHTPDNLPYDPNAVPPQPKAPIQ